MINNSVALRVVLAVTILAITGCGGSDGGQASSAVSSAAAPVSAASTSLRSAATSTAVTTTVSPTIVATTPTATLTTPPPVSTDGPFESGAYSGSGPGIVSVRIPPDNSAVLTFSCPACSGAVKVVTDGFPPLLIDKTGPYEGQILLAADTDQQGLLTISADADWTATIVALSEHPATPLATSGEGDAVVVITDPATSVALTHEGDGEFSVKIFNADGTSLTINESGPFSDAVAFQSPAIITVTADGPWTISAAQGA